MPGRQNGIGPGQEPVAEPRTSHSSNTREQNLDVARLSLLSNALLAGVKLAVGFLTGAVAILSDGINSTCDLFATGVAYFALSRSGEPPDEDHPWGHGKYESVAGVFEALVIAGAGVFVVRDAIMDLLSPSNEPVQTIGLVVMIVSTVANFLLSRRVLRTAQDTDSIALRAEGQHIRTDMLTSGGVLLALVVTRIWHVPHLQDAAALCVSVMIFRASYKVATIALAPLLDKSLPTNEMTLIHELLKSDPDVRGYHRLRTRRSGSTRVVDVHVLLADELSFSEAHQHSEKLERRIEESLPGSTDVVIHAEPFQEEMVHQQEDHADEVRF